ncbi:MAG: preprotein translocase subunit SecE [Candidatus Nomurabacteria bacterium]|nr:preprotein translocase subunit SecE [Candidatus Nomurabacteria bacterium]USN88224.1 MAG: preprotein translocase subunit SecE [Candidatus Nomurabacteria bacterium]
MSNFGNYLRDTAAEMKQVSWPTQKQAFLYTILVIVISALVSLFLGAFDYVFQLGIDTIINRI